MGRILAVVYGVLSYLVFLISFLYAIGFVTNFGVPKGIDSGAPGPVPGSVIVNMLLMGLFAVQHSVMARPAFKRWWTRIIPESIERSTYVLLSSLALILLYWLWQPIPGLVWSVEGAGATILWAICALGWAVVLLSTLMIGHFELFGLQQVYQNLKNLKPAEPNLITPGFYALVRHPIMTGFIIAFWATPQMSWGHLLFAAVTTAYIVIALQFEERDLIGLFGDRYREYSAKVPMLVPFLKRRGGGKKGETLMNISYFAIPVVLLGSIVLGTAIAEPVAEKALASAPNASDLNWGPCPTIFPAGCEIAVLHGDPAAPNADVFLRVPAKSALPAHWHTSAERMVLVSGELQVTYQGQPAATLTPGSYAYGPPKLPHKAVCVSSDACTLFIAFESPIDAVLYDGPL